jgi:hypothetical protein
MKECNILKFDHISMDTHIKSVMDGNSFTHDEYVNARLQKQTIMFESIDVY